MKKKISIIMIICVCFICFAAVNVFAEQYEAEFREMDLEQLQSLQTLLTNIINEKKIGNAILTVDPEEINLAAGKSIKLVVSSDERIVTAKTKLTYESSDDTIAKVNKGQVTAINSGSAVITVKAEFEDGAILESSCNVSVYVPVTAIKTPQKATAFVGSELDLGELITITPDNASNKQLKYSVDDNSIITINDNGIVKGLKGGSATITIESAQENTTVKPVKVKVSVDEAVSEIRIKPSNITLGKGSSHKLEASIGPESATNKAVEWKSEDPKIAIVSSTGIVQGKGTGTTNIICTAKDGSGTIASSSVTVITQVSSLTISKKQIDLMDGQNTSIDCEVIPKDASNKKIIWSSSNSGIASVDDKGRITAKRTGTCTITATAADGSGKTASTTVYVEPKNPVSVNSIHWQTVWGAKNGKMGVYGKSNCVHRKIKSFKYKIEITTWFGNTSTDIITYSGPAINPGKTGRSKLTSYSVSGFTTAAKIKITVLSVTFSDGTEYTIPASDQDTSYFEM